MKIGIITQPLLANYGGILQNYALQEVLRRMGHIPITIDYTLRNSLWRCFRHRLRHLLSGAKGEAPGLLRLRSQKINHFVERNIALSERVDRYDPSLVDRYGFEALLVGSDQVWRPKYNRYLEDMFLQFAQHKVVRRVAYAASFGVDRWEFTPAQTKRCRALAQAFNAITVREASGIGLCREKLGVEAEQVLDPTLLLQAKDYERLLPHSAPDNEPYLAAYLLGHDQKRRTLCDKIARQRGLKVRYFGADAQASLSVEEWLTTLFGASMVITDSFHGTVFSILGHREFLTLGHRGRGLSRLHSLLRMVGLEERLCEILPQDKLPLPAPIVWEEVDRRLQEERQASLKKLRIGLEKDSTNEK